MGYEDYWNLAGIPVDARFEAQRAAREAGVSVGDWLTRRILSEATSATGRSHSDDPVSDHFRDLKSCLTDLEFELHAYPTREAVEKLGEQLSRLANDLVQTTGRSSIELSALANRTDGLEAQLSEVHNAAAEAVETKFAEIAKLTAAQRANNAAELASFATRLDRVSSEAGQAGQAIAQEMARLTEQAAAEQRALSGQVIELRQHVDGAKNETAGRHDTLEKRLETLFAQTNDLLAERLEDLSAGLDAARNEAAGTASTLTQQLKQVTAQSSADDDALAARIDALAGDLAGLRGNALNADAVGQKLAPLSDRLAALETALPDRTAGLESKVQRLLSERLETVEATLTDRSAKLEAKVHALHASQKGEIADTGNRLTVTAEDLAGAKQAFAGQLSDHATRTADAQHALSARLGSLVAQTADTSSAATQALEVQLRQAIEQVAARDAALTAKLAELEAALAAKSAATQALEQRVVQLTHLFGDAQIATAGENEKLHARLGEFQAQTAETIRSLQEQHAGVQHDFAARDATFEDHRRSAKEDMETLSGSLASLQGDLGSLAERHAAHEGDTHTALEEMQARFDAGHSRAQQVSGALDNRLSEIAAGLTELEGRLESETKRSVADAARESEQTQKKIATLEQGLEQSLEQVRQDASAQASDLRNALQVEAQELSRIESRIPDTGALETRLSEVEDTSSKRIVSLANNMQGVAELLAATRGEAANASAAMAERLSALQATLEKSDARSGDTSAALAACVQSVHELKSGTMADTGVLNRLVRENYDDATAKLGILGEKLLDLGDRLDAVEKETPAKSGAVQKLLIAVNGILNNVDERRHPIGAALPQTDKETTAASLENLEHALGELEAVPAPVIAEKPEADEPQHDEAVPQAESLFGESEPPPSHESFEPAAEAEHADEAESSFDELFGGAVPAGKPEISHDEPQPEAASPFFDVVEEYQAGQATSSIDEHDDRESHAAPSFFEDYSEQEAEQAAPLLSADEKPQTDVIEPATDSDNAHREDNEAHTDADAAGADAAVSAEAQPSVPQDAQPGDLKTSSFLTAARQSAKAAHLSAVEPAGENPLRSAVQSFVQNSAQKPHAKLLAAGAAVVAVGVLGTGLVLELSSHHKPASHHPVVVADTKAAKPAVLKPAIVNPVDDLDRIVALARGGDAHAQLQVGLRYLLGANGVAPKPDEALKWLEMAANKGEPVAQYRAGALYSGATGIKPDPAKALQYFRSAADAGNRKAMYNLALAYVRGAGTKADNSEAVRWFLKAANLGLVDAQFDLAVLYERGNGVPQSLMDAYRWYAIAAKEGDIQSKQRAEALSTQLPADDRSAAEVAAEQFKPMPMDPRANEVRP